MLPRTAEVAKAMSALASLAAKQLLEKRTEATSAHSAKAAEVEAIKRRAVARILVRAAVGCVVRIGVAPLLAILVVFLPLFRVAYHVVSFVEGLKFSLSLRVIRMQVGMKLLGALEVCALNILLWDIPVNAENLVVIYKCHNFFLLVFICHSCKNYARQRKADNFFSQIL